MIPHESRCRRRAEGRMGQYPAPDHRRFPAEARYNLLRQAMTNGSHRDLLRRVILGAPRAKFVIISHWLSCQSYYLGICLGISERTSHFLAPMHPPDLLSLPRCPAEILKQLAPMHSANLPSLPKAEPWASYVLGPVYPADPPSLPRKMELSYFWAAVPSAPTKRLLCTIFRSFSC